MTKIQRVVKKIEAKGFKTRIDESAPREIYWSVGSTKYFVYETDIAELGKSLAWFQSSDNDDHLLVVYEDNDEYNWVPETYNPVFGCDCIYIGWRDKYLVFIYLEKHDIYICATANNEVKHLNFSGEDLFVGDDTVTYSSFGEARKGKVNLVSLPSVEKSCTIDVKDAEKRGIQPVYYQEYLK